MRKNLNIAVVGATGLVGQKIIEVLSERNIRANYHFFALESGATVKLFGKTYIVSELNMGKIEKLGLDYAFFAVEGEISQKYAPIFAELGVTVIDNSSAFRREEDVPLVVPQVNASALKKGGKIIANPNCSTIQLVTALKPLDQKFKIKRVVVSTYQAVSGAGQKGLSDLENKTQNKFPHPIFDNLIPQIDDFLPNGYTKEEDKLIFESRKILSRPDLEITATAVRVPITNSHSESVNIEFERKADLDQIFATLKNAENVILLDDTDSLVYPMPICSNGHDEVYVGRIRQDFSRENTFNMFIVADNLRRGAASNAVDIFQKLEALNEP